MRLGRIAMPEPRPTGIPVEVEACLIELSRPA
jgi:hypothetical protein